MPIRLRIEAAYESESGSPPLWKNSPVNPRDVIAQYQKEMLEKVRELPESCYELSLRDLVELSAEKQTSKTEAMPRVKAENRKEEKSVKDGKKFARTESMNNGVFLLKLFFPLRSSPRSSSSKPSFAEGHNSASHNRRGSIGWHRSLFQKSCSFCSRIKNKGACGGLSEAM